MLPTPSLRLPSHNTPSATVWLADKKSYNIQNFTTVLGETLPSFELGYETYGNLNAQGDNAILICHYFTGNSHAAGRYTSEDPEPGYWDDLIGPSKKIDTDRFFVVAIDILCNACPSLPQVKTVGPSTIDPQTNRPYGMSFPRIAIADMVKSQKIILDHLGVSHLHAVLGASLGSMQAWQWAVEYPDFVSKIVPVIGSGFKTHPFVSAAVELWAKMLKSDPIWNGGDYSLAFPVNGMRAGLEMLTWNCLSSHWAEVYGAEGFKYLAAQRAQFIEPNHFLYIIDAVQNFDVSAHLQKMKAQSLVISADSDFLMLSEYSKEAVKKCQELGLKSQYSEITGRGGHLDGIFAIEKVSKIIGEFLLS